MPSTKAPVGYLSADEIRPVVELAGKWSLSGPVWLPYRVPSYHLLLMESGSINAKTPDGAYSASAGDLVCFRPAGTNEYGYRSPVIFYQIHLSFAPMPNHRLGPWLGDAGPLPTHVSLGDSFDEMRLAFETVCIELSQPGEVHRFRVSAAVFEILAIAARVAISGTRRIRRLDVWQRVRLQLDTDLAAGTRISQFAKQIGVGPDHFIRCFKDRFGISPKAYQMQARLREAVRLLRGTDKPIKVIAYETGFDDPRTFARSFKRQLGVKPSDLRSSNVSIPAAGVPELFVVNQHVLPPNCAPDWHRRYVKRRDAFANGVTRHRKAQRR